MATILIIITIIILFSFRIIAGTKSKDNEQKGKSTSD